MAVSFLQARHAAWALHRMFSVRWTLDETLAVAFAHDEDQETPKAETNSILETGDTTIVNSKVEVGVDKIENPKIYIQQSSTLDTQLISDIEAGKVDKVNLLKNTEEDQLNEHRVITKSQSTESERSDKKRPNLKQLISLPKCQKRHRRLSMVSFEHTDYPSELKFVTRLQSDSDEESDGSTVCSSEASTTGVNSKQSTVSTEAVNETTKTNNTNLPNQPDLTPTNEEHCILNSTVSPSKVPSEVSTLKTEDSGDEMINMLDSPSHTILEAGLSTI